MFMPSICMVSFFYIYISVPFGVDSDIQCQAWNHFYLFANDYPIVPISSILKSPFFKMI